MPSIAVPPSIARSPCSKPPMSKPSLIGLMASTYQSHGRRHPFGGYPACTLPNALIRHFPAQARYGSDPGYRNVGGGETRPHPCHQRTEIVRDVVGQNLDLVFREVGHVKTRLH